ncbi:MAG: aa3-type cytochrome c oxidase subunit IV [Hyphomicrobium sp.]
MGVNTTGGNPNMDYNEHNSTYANFLRLTKFGIIFLVILLVAMKVFLVA